MTSIKILPIVLILTMTAAQAADNRIADAGPFYVNAYLCDASQYAVQFATAVSRGKQLEEAKDIVGKAAKKEVCGRYIGIASIEEQKMIVSDGVVYRLTALLFKEDKRIAWAAELTFANEGRSSWHL